MKVQNHDQFFTIKSWSGNEWAHGKQTQTIIGGFGLGIC